MNKVLNYLTKNFSEYIDLNEIIKILNAQTIDKLELHSFNVLTNLIYLKKLGLINIQDFILKRSDLLLMDNTELKEKIETKGNDLSIYILNTSNKDLKFNV